MFCEARPQSKQNENLSLMGMKKKPRIFTSLMIGVLVLMSIMENLNGLAIPECSQFLYGCQICEQTERSPQKYYECSQCQSGLYLHSNSTLIDGVQIKTTSCVEECTSIALNLANDPFTGTCRTCGKNCKRCHPVDGCLDCDTTASKNVVVEETLNAASSTSKFKVCKSCSEAAKFAGSFPCETCNIQNQVATCLSTPVLYQPMTTGSDFVSTVSSSRIANCEVVPKDTGNSTCTQCAAPYATGEGSPQCQKQCISNCGECVNPCTGTDCLICKQCSPGSYPFSSGSTTQNGQTYTNITHCKACTDPTQNIDQGCSECPAGKCSKCFDGFVKVAQTDGSVKCTSLQQTKCHADCLQCFGTLQTQCFSCRDGKYLDKSTHTCSDKQASNGEINLHVRAQNLTAITSEDGTLTKPFSDLMRAIEWAKFEAAGATSKVVRIWLSNETHYILPSPINLWNPDTRITKISSDLSGMKIYIAPLVCGTNVGGVAITSSNSNCGAATLTPTLVNKIGAYFKFQVGGLLSIKNLIFENVDAQVKLDEACRYQKQSCCSFNSATSALTGLNSAKCQAYVEQECNLPGHVSLFTFRTSTTTTKLTPGELVLDGVVIQHIHYNLHSLVHIPNNVGKVSILNSKIMNMGTCASVITNANPVFQNFDQTQGSAIANVQAMILQKRSIRNRKVDYEILYPTVAVTDCESTHSTCTSITLQNLTVDGYFKGFAQKTKVLKGPVTSKGSMIDFNMYPGPVLVKDSKFLNNQMKLTSCGLHSTLASLTAGSIFTEGASFMQPVIKSTSGKGALEVISSDFNQVSGFSSAIIDLNPRIEGPFVLKSSKFIQNSGIYNSKMIHVEDDTTCSGIHIELNEFRQNMRCPMANESTSQPHLIYLKCNNQTKAIGLIGTPSDKTSAGGVTYNTGKVVVKTNTYHENFYTYAYMNFYDSIPTLDIGGEVYNENVGNIFKQAADLYSPFKTTLAQYTTHFTSWGGGQYQYKSYMLGFTNFKSLLLDGLTINDPADLSLRSSYKQMCLLKFTTQKDSGFHVKNVKMFRVTGGNETLIKRYTNNAEVTTSSSSSYYTVAGTDQIKKGVLTAYFITFDFGDSSQNLLWEGLEIHTYQVPPQSSLSKPIFGDINSITNFTLNNFLLKDLLCRKCKTYLMWFEHKSLSHFHFTNFTLDGYGESYSYQAYRPVFYLKSTSISSKPSINFKNMTLRRIFTYYASVAYVYQASSSGKVQAQDFKIDGFLFENLTHYYGLFYYREGYNNIQLYMQNGLVQHTLNYYYRRGLFNVYNNFQRDGSFFVTNVKFYNLRTLQSSKAYAYVMRADEMQEKNKMYWINVTVDCNEPWYSLDDAKRDGFNGDRSSKQLVRTVWHQRETTNKFYNIHVKNCHKFTYGAIYTREQPNIKNMTVENCTGEDTVTFQYNAGGSSHALLDNVTVDNCKSKYGTIAFITTGGLKITNSRVTNSYGLDGVGVFSNTYDNIDLYDVDFINNTGINNGPINYLLFRTNSSTLNRVRFINNTVGKGGLISLSTSYLSIYQCTFMGNKATEGFAGVYGLTANLYIYNSTFDYPSTTTPQTGDGGYISILLNSKVVIKQTYFKNGYFQKGGGLMIDGKSDITLINCTFDNIRTVQSGSAMYITNTNQVTATNVNFINCYNDEVILGGGMIYAQIKGTLTITDSKFIVSSFAQSSNLIFGNNFNFDFNRITINGTNNPTIANLTEANKGGAIHLENIKQFKLQNSIIEGVQGLSRGGAIFFDYQTYTLNPEFTHIIHNVTIKNNKAKSYGGGLYLHQVLKLKMTSVIIDSNKVLNGSGGGLFYSSSLTNKAVAITLDSDSRITNNWASGSGGALSYNFYKLENLPTSIIYNNTADLYGADIASYPHSILVLTRRNLVTNFLKGLQSGGTIPTIKAAIVDDMSQIIKTDSSSTVTLKAVSSNKNFSTILKGATTVQVIQGQFEFKDVVLITTPGSQLSLQFVTNAIDSTLPNNQPSSANNQTDAFNKAVTVRSCSQGEAFLLTGECAKCVEGKEYLLTQLNTTGNCKPCVTSQMICRGGSDIGPQPGYWRSSNTSLKFYECLRPQSCLGMTKPKFSQTGECAQGFKSKLCAQCQPGYSMTGEYDCSLCPHIALNIFRIIGTAILAIILIVIMVRSTIQGSTKKKKLESIYFKILMNHFQLVVLASTFELRWPPAIVQFFDIQKPIATISTQFLSVDCFLHEFQGAFDDTGIRIYFFKLILYAILPIVLMIITCIFWKLRLMRICRGNPTKFASRSIATIIILLFLIHPSIVQTMFGSINCKDIDGTEHIQLQIEVVCYSKSHMIWVGIVTIPSLVIWGLGIPSFAWGILFKNRKKLTTNIVRQNYGFLLNGYKRSRYYWESVIMYRKIIIIFISVQLKGQGAIMQALFVALLLVVFLILNMQLTPFQYKKLNQMETMSIFASLITVYCGFFYLSHRPEIYTSKNQELVTADNGFRLTQTQESVLFLTIILSNCFFLLLWAWRFVQELLVTMREKVPRLYAFIFLCNSQKKLKVSIHTNKIEEESSSLRGELEILLNDILKAYDKKDIMLNRNILERLQVYLSVEKVKEEIRYVNPKDPEIMSPIIEDHHIVKRVNTIYQKQIEADPVVEQKKFELDADTINDDIDVLMSTRAMQGGQLSSKRMTKRATQMQRQKSNKNRSQFKKNTHIQEHTTQNPLDITGANLNDQDFSKDNILNDLIEEHQDLEFPDQLNLQSFKQAPQNIKLTQKSTKVTFKQGSKGPSSFMDDSGRSIDQSSSDVSSSSEGESSVPPKSVKEAFKAPKPDDDVDDQWQNMAKEISQIDEVPESENSPPKKVVGKKQGAKKTLKKGGQGRLNGKTKPKPNPKGVKKKQVRQQNYEDDI